MSKLKWFKTVFLRPFALILVAVSFLGILIAGLVTGHVMHNIITENVILAAQGEEVVVGDYLQVFGFHLSHLYWLAFWQQWLLA